MSWPSDWKERVLGSFAEARGGTGFPIALQGRSAGQLPFYKVSDMNGDGNSTWMHKANNYISDTELRELGGRAFEAKTIVFPKIGATIYTNKKRILATTAIVDNNVMGVTVTDYTTCLPEFLFFWFQHLELAKLSSPGTVPSITSTRVKSQKVMLPSRDEQERIVAVLSAVQRAIERQERLIALTAELKKALMQKLFTEGTCGDPLNQTDIGLLPTSWNVEPLGRHLVKAQYGISVKGAEDGATPMLRMTNQVDGRIVADNLQMVNLSESDFAKYQVQSGDVLFNRTNSFELVGRTAIFDLPINCVFASYLIRLRTVADTLRPAFLNHYFNWDATQNRLKGIASRAVSQSNISASRLRGFLVSRPPVEEQDGIIRCLDQLDRVRTVRHRQVHVLKALFRTLLHQLMTAQMRVQDLDLSALNGAVHSGRAD